MPVALGQAADARSPPGGVTASQRQTGHRAGSHSLHETTSVHHEFPPHRQDGSASDRASYARFAGPGKESAAGIGKPVAGIGGFVVSFGRESALPPNAVRSPDGSGQIRRLTRLRGYGSDASSRARRAERAGGVLDEDQLVVRTVGSEERPEPPPPHCAPRS